IEQTDPEGAYLESVMGPDPVRRVGAVHIGHYHADDAGQADDQADQIEDVDDLGGLALDRIAASPDRVDLGRVPALGRDEIDYRAAARRGRAAPFKPDEIV